MLLSLNRAAKAYGKTELVYQTGLRAVYVQGPVT